MRFENNKSGNGGVITLNNELKEIGRLTYTIFPDENKFIISFVLVHPEFEGRGMGKYLVEEAIKFARENNWKVYPHCSYARSVMMRMNDVDDVFTTLKLHSLRLLQYHQDNPLSDGGLKLPNYEFLQDLKF